MSKFVNIKIAINIDGKTEIHDAKMEEGMHFQNNGDTYSIKDGSIWNSNNQKVDSIKMTKYQFNIFQALANNVKEDGENDVVLSQSDINDEENGAIKKWSLGQFGADMAEFINKSIYSVKGTHHHKNKQGQTDGVEMDVVQKNTQKTVATLRFWFENVSKEVQIKKSTPQENIQESKASKKEEDVINDEPHENFFKRICNRVKQMFEEEPIKNSYPEGVEEVPSYEYKIKSGDRVITIVNENGISMERLLQTNAQLDTNKISVGQIINIPKRYSVENTPVLTKEDVANYSNLSMEYINFLMNFETLHKEPYNDNVGSGTLTVGYGHTGRLLGKYYKNCKAQDLDKRIEINSKNTSQIKLEEEDANQILAQDLINSREDAISYFGESFLKAPLSIQEAIIDIIFNKGIKKGLEGINDNGKEFDTPTKEIKKYLAEGNYEEVAKHVIYGTQNKGLQKRNIGRVLLACRDLDEKTRKRVLESCGEDYEKMLAQYGNTAEIIKIKNQWNEYLHPEYSVPS